MKWPVNHHFLDRFIFPWAMWNLILIVPCSFYVAELHVHRAHLETLSIHATRTSWFGHDMPF